MTFSPIILYIKPLFDCRVKKENIPKNLFSRVWYIHLYFGLGRLIVWPPSRIMLNTLFRNKIALISLPLFTRVSFDIIRAWNVNVDQWKRFIRLSNDMISQYTYRHAVEWKHNSLLTFLHLTRLQLPISTVASYIDIAYVLCLIPTVSQTHISFADNTVST